MKGILFAAIGALFSLNANAQLTLHGAVQFPDEHVFTRALVRFQELTEKYSGQKINWVLHKNSELGLEKQYFEYMAQGKAVDYGIVSPAHMSTFSKAAPFIDALTAPTACRMGFSESFPLAIKRRMAMTRAT